MWDHAKRYPEVTPAYCREACAREVAEGRVCANCPRPRLLAEALPGVLAYSTVQTQWRHAPNGAITGLAYGDCLAALERLPARLRADYGLEISVDELMDDVRAVERGLIAASRELALKG